MRNHHPPMVPPVRMGGMAIKIIGEKPGTGNVHPRVHVATTQSDPESYRQWSPAGFLSLRDEMVLFQPGSGHLAREFAFDIHFAVEMLQGFQG